MHSVTHANTTSGDVVTIIEPIVVEVLSAMNTRRQVALKRADYFASGAKEVWVIDQDGFTHFYFTGRDLPQPKSMLIPAFPQRLD
jgi:Uma2 family endonuclease